MLFSLVAAVYFCGETLLCDFFNLRASVALGLDELVGEGAIACGFTVCRRWSRDTGPILGDLKIGA